MTWTRFFFSPTGRFNRARYWGALAVQYGVAICLWMPVAFDDEAHFSDKYPTLSVVYVVLAGCITLALIVSHVFAQVKRFHDRDKPWPWIFIGFIPYIGGIWLLIELGMLPGTKGRNQFGRDPLGDGNDIIDVFDAPAVPAPPPS